MFQAIREIIIRSFPVLESLNGTIGKYNKNFCFPTHFLFTKEKFKIKIKKKRAEGMTHPNNGGFMDTGYPALISDPLVTSHLNLQAPKNFLWSGSR